MGYTVTERHVCRICGSGQLVCFLELPDMPLTDQFLSRDKLGSEFLWPVRLYFCESCGVAQTLHDVTVEDYYQDYHYSVGVSPLAQRFMLRLAHEAWRQFGLEPGDSVIEIGCSDGFQLACFQALGARVFGFEPSAPLAEVARRRGIPVAQCLFTREAIGDIPADLLPARVVVLTYTFDHLPDPMGFVNAMREVLDPARGVLIAEVHDLEKIVTRREFCLFAHEHTAYYTAATMQGVLRRAGFDLISLNLVPEAERRANSLLAAAMPLHAAVGPGPLPTLPLGPLGNADSYVTFGSAVQRSVAGLRQFVQRRRLSGTRLAGYGAGGRGVATLAAIARPGDFLYVCDKNSSLHGRYTPGSHVPIDGPGRVLAEPVDELLVFSYGYLPEIRDELGDFESRGGKLIPVIDLL